MSVRVVWALSAASHCCSFQVLSSTSFAGISYPRGTCSIGFKSVYAAVPSVAVILMYCIIDGVLFLFGLLATTITYFISSSGSTVMTLTAIIINFFLATRGNTTTITAYSSITSCALSGSTCLFFVAISIVTSGAAVAVFITSSVVNYVAVTVFSFTFKLNLVILRTPGILGKFNIASILDLPHPLQRFLVQLGHHLGVALQLEQQQLALHQAPLVPHV
mmetsp:Transcript_17040/g.32307  ORF Transcript_17040/g.32307 Transcript_17040/m.32307 type:complete len:219 (-) Transcript_17040:563-1219(-)